MNRYQLADAMIKGLHAKGVEESRKHYVAVTESKNLCKACALGCALIGQLDGDYRKAERVYDEKCASLGNDAHEFRIFADLLNITETLAFKVEHYHLQGMPIQQIAAWLKSSEETEVKTI